MQAIDVQLLKSKMAYHDYNITKLAEEIGVSRETISNLLNEEYKPSYQVMNSIYYTLKLTPEEGAAIFFKSDLRKKKVSGKEI